MSSEIKYIIGRQPYLQWAALAWREVSPEMELKVFELPQDEVYKFDLSQLNGLSRDGATAFVAQDAQFLNFRRYELMAELKSRGFGMPALVEKGATVAASAKISENTWIGAGAVVGHGSCVGFNSVIGAAANIGNNVKVGNSVWIEPGVLLGHDAKVGSHSSLGQGVIVAAGVEIGRQVVIDKAGKVTVDIPGKTFVYDGFYDVITVFDTSYT